MKKILFFAMFLIVALAQIASAQTLGQCPEPWAPAGAQCLYAGSPPPQVVPQVTPQPTASAPAVVTPPVSPTASVAPASALNEKPFNPWPWIIGLLGLGVIGVVIWLILRGDQRMRDNHRAVEVERLAQERRRARLGLEDEIVAAQVAYDRNPNPRAEDRLMWAQIALHRHDQPDKSAVGDGHVQIAVAHGHGNITGALFLGEPIAVQPAAPPAPDAVAANP